jgi:Lectin C-type domain
MQVNARQLNWSEARAECKRRNMDLVSAETAEEHQCVVSLIQAAGLSATPFLHGLNGVGQKRFSRWLNGAPLTFNAWTNAIEPVNVNENCATYLYVFCEYQKRSFYYFQFSKFFY